MATAAEKITKSDGLLDIMIRLEDFLDSLDLYAYKNWIDGEIVEGPEVTKYWASFTLMFDYDKMPDPTGARRLMKHGALVEFRESEREDADLPKGFDAEEFSSMTAASYGQNSQYNSVEMPPIWNMDLPSKEIWLVEVKIPRKFIDDAFNMDIGVLVADENSKSTDIDDQFNDNDTDASNPAPAAGDDSSTGLGTPGEN